MNRSRWLPWLACLLAVGCSDLDHPGESASCAFPDAGAAIVCGEDGEPCCEAIVCQGATPGDGCDVHWVCNAPVKQATPYDCTCFESEGI